jgi:chemotaxis protein histidine kinase CheA
MPEEREWEGKRPEGTIRAVTKLEGGNLCLTISDDGRGIDPQLIRSRLKEKFPTRDFGPQTDEEVIQAICLPGFSSRDSVGEFSGRGVGLDAVREEVLKLHGSLRVKSEKGKGTAIEIVVPELGSEVISLRSA